MFRSCQMRLTRIRLQASKRFNRGLSQFQALARVIDRPDIQLIVCVRELVIGERKRWIAFERLLEQVDGFEELLSRTEDRAFDEIASAQVKIVGSEIAG